MITSQIQVDSLSARVVFEGTLRPHAGRDMDPIRNKLETAAREARSELQLDFKRLQHMNQVATIELARFVRWVAARRPELKVTFIASSVIPWATARFAAVADSLANVSVHVYDKSMYPSQRLIEDVEFSTALRTQEDVLWAREREFLPRHGLRPRMRVADIACGIGGFGAAVSRDFDPEYVICVDHSAASLQQARDWAQEHRLTNVEYRFGDAYALLLPDNAFDFVSCRLSLQVMAMPDRLMAELVRICKPGGRIYLTNEVLSGVVGYPDTDTIRRGIAAVLESTRRANLDFDYGLKTVALLQEAGLTDTRADLVVVDTLNTEPSRLACVIESWERFYRDVAEMIGALDSRASLTSGLRAQANAARHPGGYTNWPVLIGSGRKP